MINNSDSSKLNVAGLMSQLKPSGVEVDPNEAATDLVPLHQVESLEKRILRSHGDPQIIAGHLLAMGEMSADQVNHLMLRLADGGHVSELVHCAEKLHFDYTLRDYSVARRSLAGAKNIDHLNVLLDHFKSIGVSYKFLTQALSRDRVIWMEKSTLTEEGFNRFMSLCAMYLSDPSVMIMGAISRQDLYALQILTRQTFIVSSGALSLKWIWEMAMLSDSNTLIRQLATTEYYNIASLMLKDASLGSDKGYLDALVAFGLIGRLERFGRDSSAMEGSEIIVHKMALHADDRQFAILLHGLLKLSRTLAIRWLNVLIDAGLMRYNFDVVKLAIENGHVWLAEFILSSGRLTGLVSFSKKGFSKEETPYREIAQSFVYYEHPTRSWMAPVKRFFSSSDRATEKLILAHFNDIKDGIGKDLIAGRLYHVEKAISANQRVMQESTFFSTHDCTNKLAFVLTKSLLGHLKDYMEILHERGAIYDDLMVADAILNRYLSRLVYLGCYLNTRDHNWLITAWKVLSQESDGVLDDHCDLKQYIDTHYYLSCHRN